ncbi:MAG: DUF2934 domain-containing protein [Chthoniobacterales bacterium]|nr:DUF2934 domain-containing protein [Chthoniobacterales bacterium]
MAKTAKPKMSKTVKKAVKTTPVKTAKKKAAAARTRAVTATPTRVMTRKQGGKSEIVGLIGSVTNHDIAVRAYFIAEKRRELGLPGDAESDWLEAERQLRR